MEMLWVKKGNALVPADPVTEDILHQITNGTTVTTDSPRQRRNGSYHRLMMSMLQKVYEHAWPRFATVDDLMDWLKLKSGMVKEFDLGDGKIRLKFQSVSFSSMGEIRFRAVSEQWRAIIAEEFGIDPESLLAEAA